MQNRFPIVFGLLFACLPLTMAAAEIEQNETIRKTYPLAGVAPKKVHTLPSTP